MKSLLIYDASGYDFETLVEIKEFQNKEELLIFINKNNIKEDCILGAYTYFTKIEFEAVEKVIEYKIK